jgi:hypothetical protein
MRTKLYSEIKKERPNQSWLGGYNSAVEQGLINAGDKVSDDLKEEWEKIINEDGNSTSIEDLFNSKYKKEEGFTEEQTAELNTLLKLSQFFRDNTNDKVYRDGSTNGMGNYASKSFRTDITDNLGYVFNQLYQKTNNKFIKDVLKTVAKNNGFTEKQQDILERELLKHRDIRLKGIKK